MSPTPNGPTPVGSALPTVTPIRVGFVLHVMQVAGAEVLVAETIRRLRGEINPVILCLDSVGTLGERLRADGTEVVVIGRRPGLDHRAILHMASAIKERGIELVHAHQYTPFFYGALGARLSGRAPKVIFTEHGRHFPDVVGAKRRFVNRWVLDRLADRVNGVCAFSVRALSDNDGFRHARIEVIPNGIDAARYGTALDRRAARIRLCLDPDRRAIVHIARFHPVKDQTTLLRAFAALAASNAETDLVLVGDGPLRTELESLSCELGIAHRVHFLGIRDDVPEVLAAADVFVLSSLSEGASITLLEAMASSLPVVVTDVGGSPEIVRDTVDGLLTPRGDADAMARAIRRLLDDPSAASSMGRSGATRIRSVYRLDTTVQRYFQMYRELCRPAVAAD
jgi:glycosyltransferase involved in cell wall biosynthesis